MGTRVRSRWWLVALVSMMLSCGLILPLDGFGPGSSDSLQDAFPTESGPTADVEPQSDGGQDAPSDGGAEDDAQARPREGLVGEWLFDSSDGGTIFDTSGHGNNGALLGAATLVDLPARGAVLELYGRGDMLRVSALDLAKFPTSGTLAMWLFAEPASLDGGTRGLFDGFTAARSHLFLRQTEPSSPSSITLQLAMQPGYVDGGVPPYAWLSNQVLPTSAWVHVTLTWDTEKNEGAFYRDGIELARLASTAGFKPSQQIVQVGDGFKGRVDEVRIFSRALSPSEVATLP